MATTEKGIYYPNDGTKSADVLADFKEMAESIDKTIEDEVKANIYDDTEIKKDISAIQQEQTQQNKDIENLQTNDNKQDELISKLKNVALNAETEESKSLHVTDANKFGQLSVEGNQKQETREGYSLIDFSSIGNGNLGGVSYSVENDIITLNGNYNINYPQPINNIVNNIPKINSNFRFQIYPISGSCENTRIGIRFNYANGGQIDYIQDVVNSNNYVTKAMDLTELNTVSFFIAGRNDATFNNYKFKLMFIEGTEEKPYEQYGASPSPEYPGKIVCLGSNKQLFNKDDMNTLQGYIDGRGTIIYHSSNKIAYIECPKNTDITVSGKYLRGIACYNQLPTYSLQTSVKNINQATYLTLNTGDNTYLAVWYYENNSGYTEQEIIDSIKVEEGTEATSYSPYGQGSTKISKINKNLFNKETAIQGLLEGDGSLSHSDSRYYTSDFIQVIPGQTYYKTYSGSSRFKFFDKNKNPISNTYNDLTDPTGAQSLIIPENVHYIRFTFLQTSLDSIQIEKSFDGTEYIEHQQTDYLLYIQQEMLKGDYFVKEADGWKEVHNYSKINSDNFNNITENTAYSGLFMLTVEDLYRNDIETSVFSDYYKAVTPGYMNSNLQTTEYNISAFTNNRIFITHNDFANNLSGLKNFLIDNNVSIFAKTTTPTKLACTPEQSAVLEELSNLELFDGTNNIITAEDIALLKLKYALDVKTYVDNKLNTIN